MLRNKPRYITFKKFQDKKGYLIPFESSNEKVLKGNKLPIKIKRIFFSSGKKNYFRGDHAHKRCSQLLMCLKGQIKIETIFKNRKKIFKISENKLKTVLIPPMVWNRIFFLKRNSLLGVICDYKYDSKKEYIHNFKEFKKLSLIK